MPCESYACRLTVSLLISRTKVIPHGQVKYPFASLTYKCPLAESYEPHILQI